MPLSVSTSPGLVQLLFHLPLALNLLKFFLHFFLLLSLLATPEQGGTRGRASVLLIGGPFSEHCPDTEGKHHHLSVLTAICWLATLL